MRAIVTYVVLHDPNRRRRSTLVDWIIALAIAIILANLSLTFAQAFGAPIGSPVFPTWVGALIGSGLTPVIIRRTKDASGPDAVWFGVASFAITVVLVVSAFAIRHFVR